MGMSRCAIYLSECDEAEAVRIAIDIGILDACEAPIRKVSDQSEVHESEIGVSSIGNWAVIFGDSDGFIDGEHFASITSYSKERSVFCWLTQSTCGGLWFELHRNNELRRKWIQIEGVVEMNFGEKLHEEASNVFTSDPDSGEEEEILDLAGRITGITDNQIFNIPFTVYAQKV